MSNFLIVIPARYNSKRLPGKPLINLKGLPMVVRTYYQCLKAVDRSKIIVATDDKRVKKVCDNYNLNSIITSKRCLTGTDRVAEVSKKIKRKFYINVQGDEPNCNPKDILKIIDFTKKNSSSIINGYTDINNKKDYFSPHIPKIVFDNKKNLLYMSRAPIPHNKKSKFIKGWRQVCIYSFPYKSLKIYSSQKNKTDLEEVEDLELNRFLELGYKIKMIKMSNKSIAVDTKKDVIRIRKIIKKFKK